MDFANYWFSSGAAASGGGDPGDPIGNSLRFRANDRTLLSKYDDPFGQAFQANGTISFWFKQSTFTTKSNSNRTIFMCRNTTKNKQMILWNSTGPGEFVISDENGTDRKLPGLMRDTNAWYHLVIWSNSPKVWLNGVDQGFTANGWKSWQTCTTQRWGAWNVGDNDARRWFDGYLAEAYCIDGTHVDVSEFGRFNDNGIWVPKKPSFTQAQYGTNGYYLDFSDPNNIGKDRSGNNNDFTDNNFELVDTSSRDYDWMADSPTQNYATFNPIYIGPAQTSLSGGIFGANLNHGTSSSVEAATNFYLPKTGKYYCEVEYASVSSSIARGLGLADASVYKSNGRYDWSTDAVWHLYVAGNNQIYRGANLTSTSTGYVSTNATIQMAVDCDTRNVWFGVNNQWYNASTDLTGDPSTLSNPTATLPDDVEKWIVKCPQTNGGTGSSQSFNAGQRPFSYTPPNGFEALQTENLPEAPIVKAADHFKVISTFSTGYAGDCTSSSGAWVGSGTYGPNKAFDGLVGSAGLSANSYCQTSTSDGVFTWEPSEPIPISTNLEINVYPQSFKLNLEITVDGVTTTVSSLDVNGPGTEWFEVFSGSGNLEKLTCTGYHGGSFMGFKIDGQILVDDPILDKLQSEFPSGIYWVRDRTNTIDYYQMVYSLTGMDTAFHCKGNTPEVTPYTPPTGDALGYGWNIPDEYSDSSITAGRRNLQAGMSMCTYTGDGAASKDIAHGLPSTPQWTYLIDVDSIGDHMVAAPGCATGKYVAYNRGNGETATNYPFVTFDPTHISVTGSKGNVAGRNYFMYNFIPIPGFSEMGFYTGNGNAEGPFVHCPFKPAFVLFSKISGNSWPLINQIECPNNPVNTYFSTSNNSAETRDVVDILSNGFKIRSSTARVNTSGSKYTYLAFAEYPFGGGNTVPVTAR